MKKRLIITGLLLLLLVFPLKVYHDTNYFKVNQETFRSAKLPADASFSITHLSDLHNKVFGDNNEELVSTVEKLNADMVVITGDMIDRHTEEFDQMFSLLERITEINEHVFFVTGNHDFEHPDFEQLLSGLRERGVTVLDNKNRQITVNGVPVNVVGIDDVATNHEQMGVAFQGISNDNYTILLSHAPEVINEYDNIPADLVLSGHTHGGQVRIPPIGAIVAPGQGLFPELDKGTFEFGQDQLLYIDSGLGTSLLPIRLFNQSQLSLITVSGVG
ncbi:metallophosphoesterase [Lentibacillus sediminis]|uniref:metallophosphoesterase n=1 Tax=Lentibacillus sediminis TaxID=1940529 RepID=UPI000C1C81BB|nr:metallophosphoesterase [Lentibacillus sediminis]